MYIDLLFVFIFLFIINKQVILTVYHPRTNKYKSHKLELWKAIICRVDSPKNTSISFMENKGVE